MPEDVKCVPGHPAFAGKPVAITRVGGFGATQGTVDLVTIVEGQEVEDPMTPVRWASEAIQATVPHKAQGDPPYYVKITANGTTYTGPIDVRSLPNDGSGFPPAQR